MCSWYAQWNAATCSVPCLLDNATRLVDLFNKEIRSGATRKGLPDEFEDVFGDIISTVKDLVLGAPIAHITSELGLIDNYGSSDKWSQLSHGVDHDSLVQWLLASQEDRVSCPLHKFVTVGTMSNRCATAARALLYIVAVVTTTPVDILTADDVAETFGNAKRPLVEALLHFDLLPAREYMALRLQVAWYLAACFEPQLFKHRFRSTMPPAYKEDFAPLVYQCVVDREMWFDPEACYWKVIPIPEMELHFQTYLREPDLT